MLFKFEQNSSFVICLSIDSVDIKAGLYEYFIWYFALN